MFGLFFTALTHRPDQNLLRQFRPPVVPAITREQVIHIDPAHYQRYTALTHWQHEAMHPCYLQVCSLPLQLKCLAHKRSPFPLLGLVHRMNRIRQVNHADKLQPFEIRVGFSAVTPHSKGWDVVMYTRALQHNALVYEAQATYLVRVKAPHVENDNPAGRKHGQQTALEYDSSEVSLLAPADIGRRYAKVSGDANPIHLFGLTARLFGFPKAIAHGMWTLATSVSHLYPSAPVTEVVIECAFKRPLVLPGEATLKKTADDGVCQFLLENKKEQEPVLSGTLHSYYAL